MSKCRSDCLIEGQEGYDRISERLVHKQKVL